MKKQILLVALIFLLIGMIPVQAGLIEDAKEFFSGVKDAMLTPTTAELMSVASFLSVDPIDYSTNGVDFTNEWLVALSAGSGAESLSGSISHGELEDEGTVSEQGFTIDVDVTDQTCDYTFENKGFPVYRISHQQVKATTNTHCDNICIGEKSNGCFYSKFEYLHKCDLYYKTLDATMYVLDKKGEGFTIETTIRSDDGSIAKGTLTSTSTDYRPVVAIKDPYTQQTRAKVYYQGSLKTTTDCAGLDTIGHMGVYDYSSGKIYPVSKDAYERPTWGYTALLGREGLFIQCVQDERSPSSCVDMWNGRVNTLERDTSSSIRSSTGAKSVEVSGSTLVVHQRYLTQFPILKMRIDADWLGIIAPEGEPKIKSIECGANDVLESGYEGYVTATVKNVGDGRGTFDVSLRGCDKISTLSHDTLTLDRGETGTAYIHVKAVSTGTEYDSCLVVATDRNSGNEDTKAFRCKIELKERCNVGSKRCMGKYIQECDTDGVWNTVETCDTGCKERFGQDPICKEDDDDNGFIVRPTDSCERCYFDCEQMGGVLDKFSPMAGFRTALCKIKCWLFVCKLVAILAGLFGGLILAVSSLKGGAGAWVGVAVFATVFILSMIISPFVGGIAAIIGLLWLFIV